jgi:hypothetical protein
LNEELDNTDQLLFKARHFVYAQEFSRFPRLRFRPRRPCQAVEVARAVPLDVVARGFRSPGVVEEGRHRQRLASQTVASSSHHNKQRLASFADSRFQLPPQQRRCSPKASGYSSSLIRCFGLHNCRCRVPKPLQELITLGRTLVKRTADVAGLLRPARPPATDRPKWPTAVLNTSGDRPADRPSDFVCRGSRERMRFDGDHRRLRRIFHQMIPLYAKHKTPSIAMSNSQAVGL